MNSELAKNHYAVVRNFINTNEANKLGNKFIDYANKHNLESDDQVIGSPAIYNYLPFVRLLVENINKVENCVGEKLLPTYTYARIYRNGAVLEKHTDRPACEISITLNLKTDVVWPIYFQTPSGNEVELMLNPGDAAVYLGCVSPHWRNKFNGQESVQVFLHYVNSYGKNAWAFFDKEKVAPPTPPEGSNGNFLPPKQNMLPVTIF